MRSTDAASTGNPTSTPTPFLVELRELLGERLSTNETIRRQHGEDESSWRGVPPDAVAMAHSTEEVSAIAALCHRYRVPMIPFGTGTSVEGHVHALHGGLSVDLSEMNAILRVSPEDMDCTVQAGVTRNQLNRHLRDTGLFFPVDPGADASLGGMAATRASGTNAVRYGTMRENVLGLKVVLADGRVIKTGTRARKSSAGYDLTHLFVGSEGTLGFITEVTLRLHPLQEAIVAASCAFPTVHAAVKTVIETIQSGVPIARIELLDSLQIRAVNRMEKSDYPESPHLFLEFHGTQSGVHEQVETVKQLAHDHGGSDFAWAENQEERNRLWHARHNAFPATLQLRPGSRAVITDVCVPISRLAECIDESLQDIDRSALPITLLGHVGDGNFHLLILIDPDDEGERREAEAINQRLVRRALAMGGTCTGEHGIGRGKREFLLEEHGAAVEVMRDIKTALDPDNLMNPGKIFLDP
ncbi:MAG: FAD-linked oxidase C-terminal domain-containing protein [Gammaproteobacteria bacterium]